MDLLDPITANALSFPSTPLLGMERELIIDSKKLLDAGYLIVPECVPPDRLESMRAHCEQMVERHKTWWAEQRTLDQPPGDEWEVGKQPRVLFDRVIDRQNHESVEFLFHENTYGISKQIMQTEDVVPTQFGMFCNPRIDHGPSDWHRDISPPVHGPVESYYTDFLNNPPCYTQWNIALYDDDVFWLVPGSHRRFNTATENQQLSISEHAPIDGGMPIELRAGDGIVYLTQEEADLLWQRFAEFDRLLQVDEPHLIPGFQCKEPTTYRFEEMPAMDVDEFIASW